MNGPPTSGGCYLTLSQMDNICSCWEFNPITKRIRVVAPKTKLEPYPDYETDEDKTARLVAGLCNRRIPTGRNQPERRRGSRSQSPFSSGGEEEDQDSGYETAEREAGEVSAGDDTAPSSGRRRQGRRRKGARGDEQAGSNDEFKKPAKTNDNDNDSKKRKRSRSGQLDKSSRRKNKRVKRSTQSAKQIAKDPDDDYTITNTDFRKWRDSISNKRGRRKKQARRTSADRSSSDEFSNDASSDDSRSSIRKWGASSVIVENPAFKRHERLKNPRKRFGSVTAVRATDVKKRRRKQRTTESNNEFGGTGDHTGSGNESGGLIIDDEKPITNVESFWS
jgi:hypothetical protein